MRNSERTLETRSWMFLQEIKERKRKKKRLRRTGLRIRSVGVVHFIESSPSFIRQVNEMAGGGQAGELEEDKLDKGMQVLHLAAISHTEKRCSGRPFPAAHLEAG